MGSKGNGERGEECGKGSFERKEEMMEGVVRVPIKAARRPGGPQVRRGLRRESRRRRDTSCIFGSARERRAAHAASERDCVSAEHNVTFYNIAR
jgi:hypothetical protein